jgi:hypothetical protein
MRSNSSVVDNFHNWIEEEFSHLSDDNKSANRRRVLRKILDKAVNLQQQINQQPERYVVQWFSPGTPFSRETMKMQTAELIQGPERVVQYCHQPLLTKMLQNGSATVIISRATVTCT